MYGIYTLKTEQVVREWKLETATFYDEDLKVLYLIHFTLQAYLYTTK